MDDADIEQLFHLMQKEIAPTKQIGCEGSRRFVRIELEISKTYTERLHPGLAESYAKFKEETIQDDKQMAHFRNEMVSVPFIRSKYGG